MNQTSNILNELQSGKCLCLVCKKVQPAGWTVSGYMGRPDFVECYDACEHENGNKAAVITWASIQDGEGTPDGLSNADVMWLQANHPEILTEMERATEDQLAALWPMILPNATDAGVRRHA